MKSQIIEIVNNVSLKFASDEAAGRKVDILEPLFYLLNLERNMRLISNMRLIASCAY